MHLHFQKRLVHAPSVSRVAVWSLEFGVWSLSLGSGFGVCGVVRCGAWGLGSGVWGLGSGALGLGPGSWGLGTGVWGLWFRIQDSGFEIWVLGFRVFGCRRLDAECRV